MEPVPDDGTEHHASFTSMIVTGIGSTLFVLFSSLEFSQMSDSLKSYVKDVWNGIDMINILLNFSLLSILTTYQATEVWILHKGSVRVIGGFSCFFMWIKVFYWMRLFEACAKYVRLIQ